MILEFPSSIFFFIFFFFFLLLLSFSLFLHVGLVGVTQLVHINVIMSDELLLLLFNTLAALVSEFWKYGWGLQYTYFFLTYFLGTYLYDTKMYVTSFFIRLVLYTYNYN